MSPVNHWEDIAQQILGHQKAVCQPLTIRPILGWSLEEAIECG